MTAIENRYDFVLLFDVKNGNPNGDPDMDNMPRVDPETGHGLVTDVCLKRKIRNYVALKHEHKKPYDIYVKDSAVLNKLHEEADKQLSDDVKKDKKNAEEARQKIMCQDFYDIRTFGAVMSTGDKGCGQVRGAIQFTFAQSQDVIQYSTHAITRCAVTNEKDEAKERTIGRKHTVPYALYRSHGFISAAFAQKTGFSDADLTLFWEAMERMFWEDHSAARGEMNVRGLYVFKHDSKLGNAAAHELFDKITIERKTDTPRTFDDYSISVDASKTEGVELIVKIDACKKDLKKIA